MLRGAICIVESTALQNSCSTVYAIPKHSLFQECNYKYAA